MSKNRESIISLYLKNIRQCDIVRRLAVAKQTVSKAIKRYLELGNTQDRAKSEHKNQPNFCTSCHTFFKIYNPI